MYVNGGRRIIPSSVKIDGTMMLFLQLLLLPSEEEDDDTLSNADWTHSFVAVILSSMSIFAIFLVTNHQIRMKD